MKKNRHYYYELLKNDKNLIDNKVWLKEALLCSLEKHIRWEVSSDSLEEIINGDYTQEEYLDFISLTNEVIAADLRKLENIED